MCSVKKDFVPIDSDKYKKVLLRERKRHTARCVANTPYVVLTGYLPWGGLGTPRGGPGIPPGRGVRVPSRGSGYPPGGVRVPPGEGGSGYHPRGSRYPPGGVPGTPGGGTRLDLTSPPPCGQTNTCENSTFPSYYVRGR